MKYRVGLTLEVDFGDGVMLEKPVETLPLIAEDIADCVQHSVGETEANLANGDVATSHRRWNVDLEVVESNAEGRA
jgi:hypothetical protein